MFTAAALDRCYDSADAPMSKEEFSDEELSSALEGVYTWCQQPAGVRAGRLAEAMRFCSQLSRGVRHRD